ncbi:hypothetical protein RJ639_043536 [Escallonia herrerae]|uniref:Uncharacterized protein n=1 Tax=Escallonia herrerae TaxID=1293975 RepID=A0AA89B1A1_9ASTE|nr:hypothetical protein RJ639_043536 [Escallonia herrerae]
MIDSDYHKASISRGNVEWTEGTHDAGQEAKLSSWMFLKRRTAPQLDMIQNSSSEGVRSRKLFLLKFLTETVPSSGKFPALALALDEEDLENMKMKEVESLKDYSSRFLELINQMKTHGEDISDRRIVEKTLISLPEKFDPIVAVIEETKDLSTLSVQEVMASLKSYEQRMQDTLKKAVESSFQSKLNVGSKNQERKP